MNTILLIVLLILILLLIRYYLTIKIVNKFPSTWSIYSLDTIQNMNYSYLKHHITPKTKQKLINIPVLYLNLDRSKNRKEFMEKQFELYQINYTRISGIEGKLITNINKDSINSIKFINNYNFYEEKLIKPLNIANMVSSYIKQLSQSELGCTLSHLKAIKYAYDNKLEYAIIMEDDCGLHLLPYWGTNIKKIMREAPKDWTIIMLFTFKCNDFSGQYKKHTKNNPCYSTAVYVINKQGINNIIEQVGHDTFVLGHRTNGQLFPEAGQADKYIYCLTPTYTYTIPLFIVADELLKSTIDNRDADMHTSYVDKIISEYNKYNNDLDDLDALVKQYNMRIMLLDVDELLKKYQIKYTLIHKTLLGVYRENKFINDKHEIGIMSTDYNTSIEQGNNNFKLYKIYKKNLEILEVKFKHTNGLILDIFIIFTEPNFSWYADYNDMCNSNKLEYFQWKIPRIVYESFQFINHTFNIPSNTENLLTIMYGINWNTPQKYTYCEGIDKGFIKNLITHDFEHEPSIKSANETKITDLFIRKIQEYKKPIIWVYWQNKNENSIKPPYLNLCMDTIIKTCKDNFEIILLNDEIVKTISIYINKNFINIKPLSMRSDYIKFSILAEYGGIWLNPDTITLKTPDFFTNALITHEFCILYLYDKVNIMAIAGNKNNRTCKYMKFIFEKISTFNGWLKKPFYITPSQPVKLYYQPWIKNIQSFYPKDIKFIATPKYTYLTQNKTRKYFWSKGDLDQNLINIYIIKLYHDNYTTKQQKMSEQSVLAADFRISKIFKRVLQ
jgi:GR25 family glycosyltransferase involved in LPS biosynthesis